MNFRKYLSVKCIMIFALFLSIHSGFKAQEKNNLSFIIKDNGSVLNVQPYLDAMQNSDMRSHRLKNKRYSITFETGLTIELFSAAEMLANGLPVNITEFPEEFPSSRRDPVFALGANNFILEYHTSSSKHH